MATCGSCGGVVTDDAKFCDNCGAAVNATAAPDSTVATPAPSPPPATTAPVMPTAIPVTKFCGKCGNGLVETAVVCPACGSAVSSVNPPSNKSKTVAVVLACFLTGWTWLYTYKVNARKFWIFFALGVVSVALDIVGFVTIANHTTCIYGTNICGTTPNNGSTYLAIGGLVSFALWMWAIIDTATKSQEWYSQYPGN